MTPEDILVYALTLAGGFLGALALTPVVRRVALATGKVAVPQENRWHRKETALFGGVAIYTATTATWAICAILLGWERVGQTLLPFMICATAIFAVGLVDDLRGMDPQHKFAAQIVVTAALLFFGFRLEWSSSGTINLFLSILWMVGITNAFNLLDNMDGLSAGVAFIAAAAVFLNLHFQPQPIGGVPLLVLIAAYLGALLGFLVYNFNPASIFMGDAGSLFIGFMLAGLTVLGRPAAPDGRWESLVPVVSIPVLILFVPILDTGFVSLMRKLFRRPISQGGRDHSSHRMVAIGFSERKAVLVLYVFSALSGLIALGLNRVHLGTGLVVMVLYFLAVLFFWMYLGRVRVYPETPPGEGQREGLLRRLLLQLSNRRRLLEVFLDLVLITLSYYAAYLLRFEGDPGPNFDFFLNSLPILIACQILCFHLLGVYRGVWHSTGVRDLLAYIKAVTLATVLVILLLLFAYRFASFSRAVFVIYWGLMLILTSLTRLSFRLLDEGIQRNTQEGRPTVIYGAGIGGQMLVKELETAPGHGLKLIGFVDDNPLIQRRKVKGYPIFGGLPALPDVIRKYDVVEIIVSFREQGTEKKKEVRGLCASLGRDVQVRRMTLSIT